MADRARTAWAEAAGAAVVSVDLSVAGLAVRLEVAGARLAEVVLPPLELHPRRAPGRPDVVVRAYDAAETGAPMLDPDPLPEPQPPTAADGQRSVRWAAQPAHGVVLLADDAPSGVGFLGAFADARRLPWWEYGAPLRQLLAWALERDGRHFLHAAAVGSPNGVVLLGGPGGMGKSSTAVSALLGGLHYLGDDYCVLTVADGPRAHALYGTAKLAPEQLSLVDPAGRLAPHVLRPGGAVEAKAILLPSRWAPERMLTDAPIRVVAIPSRDGPVGCTPISKGEALRHLAPSSLLQLAGAGAGDLRAMATLVRSVPCVRFGLDPDRSANPAAVQRLLAEVTP